MPYIVDPTWTATNSVDDIHDDHQYQYRTNIALIDHNTPESPHAFALTQGTYDRNLPLATCPQRNRTFKTYKQSNPNRSMDLRTIVLFTHDRSSIQYISYPISSVPSIPLKARITIIFTPPYPPFVPRPKNPPDPALLFEDRPAAINQGLFLFLSANPATFCVVLDS